MDNYILKVSNLGVVLRDQVILENISFTLKAGERLAIVGPNGAGKSVLFKTLLKLIPHTGKIEWASHVKIGYVPQSISVTDIPISVKEFLSFKNKDNISIALRDVRLENKGVLEKTLGNLSGGQLRRVLIAWALIDNPNVLLFDEPTTGVDVDSEEAIYRTVNEIIQQNHMTMLLISHDTHIIRDYADYLLALNKCTTVFDDSKKIMDPEIQRRIFGEVVCTETNSDR